MLSVDEALERVRLACGAPQVAVEHVGLAAAHGRVLAEDVRMDHAVPPFRRATMDGYALPEVAKPGARYRVVGRVAAGHVPAARVAHGEAVRVMTGAPVPEGTQRVVPFEWTVEVDGVAEVVRCPSTDLHVIEAGAHMMAGALVLARGLRLDAGALGVLATAGVERVAVARRPRVAVLATGDELVPVATRPGPAQIRNSNNPTLLAQAAQAGGEPIDLGVARDDEAGLARALAPGLDHDVLLVSGGVSRGDLDFVPRVLERLGVTPAFHGWSVQPGGPLWFGARGATLVFALPGNPAASFVGFELLVAPTLAWRLGRPWDALACWRLPWAGARLGSYGRLRVRPVRLAPRAEGGVEARPAEWKGSGDPFALVGLDGLALVPEAGIEAGAEVRVVRLWRGG
jgi:molybdopterin molybdotransferase